MTKERLFGYEHAFDHPLTVAMLIFVGVVLVAVPVAVFVLSACGRLKPELRRDLWARYGSWAFIAVVVLVPLLLGAAFFMVAGFILSLLCYREFSRVTGSASDRPTHYVVLFGIALLCFACVDNWYDFFVALFPLVICLIAATAILPDRPRGYLQRVALAALGFMLFGAGLGHVVFLGNDTQYRPYALFLLLAVSMNDVFAYVTGKAFGRKRWLPNTSPNKTLGGSLGALVLTTVLTVLVGRHLFAGTRLESLDNLVLLGVILSVSGQLGDLVISSVKRDLGIKDVGSFLPGFGGLLDRFDSLLLAAPAYFHFVGYLIGFGLDQPTRILT